MALVSPPRPTRRAVLAASALVLLSACTDASDESSPAGGTSLDATDGDDAVVGDAIAAITAMQSQVREAIATNPTASESLRAWDALHTDQLRLLGEESGTSGGSSTDPPTADPPTTDPSTDPPPGEDPATTAAQILAAEDTLADDLVDLAVRADSGLLARSLAALAAGIDQAAQAAQAQEASG